MGALSGFGEGFSSGYGFGKERKAKTKAKSETEEAVPVPEDKPEEPGFKTAVPPLTANKGYSQR
jgi:hypothetical protein